MAIFRRYFRNTDFLFIIAFFHAGVASGADGSLNAAEKYGDVRVQLKQLVDQHPGAVSLVTLGISDSGQPIEGVKIGTGPVNHLVVATHHGNEYGSTEVAKAVARSLSEAPIPGVSVFVVPVLNIGGYDARQRYERAGGRSYDPNRDYDGPCGGEGPFKLKSTGLLAQLVAQKNIVASATLHTYYPAVVYPWGFAGDPLTTLYDGLFQRLADSATVESRYATGNSEQVIYAANGTYEDYAYWKHGVWSLLFELGASHSPTASAVAEMIRVNVPGIRRMLETAPHERAERHEFTGKCLDRSRFYDPHDE